ncbi:Uncharacterised protein [Serratia fonticola]|nr:Uncharacterised protein [Serratia fonticola]
MFTLPKTTTEWIVTLMCVLIVLAFIKVYLFS